MKLSECKKFQLVEVVKSDDTLLERHGLLIGEEIEILSNNCLMPMQLLIRGSRVAIRKSVAALIQVKTTTSKV